MNTYKYITTDAMIIKELYEEDAWKPQEDGIVGRELEEFGPNFFRFKHEEDLEFFRDQFSEGFNNDIGFYFVSGYTTENQTTN